jgi:hypothetical protein
MKPSSVYLHIVYSNYLFDVRHNHQLGWSHLEQAKKLEPNLSYQFSIFSRGQEHKQKAAGGGSGNESVDLVSYVEFQKNYRYDYCGDLKSLRVADRAAHIGPAVCHIMHRAQLCKSSAIVPALSVCKQLVITLLSVVMH